MMRELQAFVCSTVDAVSSSNTEREVAGKRALDLLVELYRRQIWTDDRTVNAIASACLSPSMRIAVSAMRFFLGIESRIADDEQSDVQEALDMSINEHQHSKKTASRMRSTKKQKAARKKKLKEAQEKQDGTKQAQARFPALQVIRDPQGLAEKLSELCSISP